MSVQILKVAATTVTCPATMLEVINDDLAMIAVCEIVTVNDGVNVTLTFDIALTAPEDAALDAIMLAWDNSLCDNGTDNSGVEFDSGLSVQNDEVPLVGDVQKINFKGSVAATTSEAGKADVHVGSIEVKNIDTIPLVRTDPVHAVGTDGNGVLEVIRAEADDPTRMPAMGALSQDLAINEIGLCVFSGELKNVNTLTFSVGDDVWVAPGGSGVNVKPVGAGNQIQKIAQIIKADPVGTTGSALIFGAGRSNDVPNILQGKVWMGDAQDVAVPTDVYTEAEVDILIQNTINTGFTRVMAHGEIPAMSGTSKIPYDNTTPLITEGTEVFSAVVTPGSVTKKVKIHINMLAAAHSKLAIFAVFRDSVCIGSMMLEDEGDDDPFTSAMLLIDQPATTSPVTYSLRAGTCSSSGKWYINRIKYNKLNNTIAKNGYVIEEFE